MSGFHSGKVPDSSRIRAVEKLQRSTCTCVLTPSVPWGFYYTVLSFHSPVSGQYSVSGRTGGSMESLLDDVFLKWKCFSFLFNSLFLWESFFFFLISLHHGKSAIKQNKQNNGVVPCFLQSLIWTCFYMVWEEMIHILSSWETTKIM